MTTTLNRLRQSLVNITRLTSQVEEEYRANRAVEQNWPREINEARQEMLDAYSRLARIEDEIETSIARRMESGDALVTLVEKLRDILTVIGEGGANLAFLQATSKTNLQVFTLYILKFREVFQEVVEELEQDEFDTIVDIIESAKETRQDEGISGRNP